MKSSNGSVPRRSNLSTKVRGDFGLCVEQNVCHGSRTPEGADREIGLWFDKEELVAWKPPEVLVMPPEPAGKAYS